MGKYQHIVIKSELKDISPLYCIEIFKNSSVSHLILYSYWPSIVCCINHFLLGHWNYQNTLFWRGLSHFLFLNITCLVRGVNIILKVSIIILYTLSKLIWNKLLGLGGTNCSSCLLNFYLMVSHRYACSYLYFSSAAKTSSFTINKLWIKIYSISLSLYNNSNSFVFEVLFIC